MGLRQSAIPRHASTGLHGTCTLRYGCGRPEWRKAGGEILQQETKPQSSTMPRLDQFPRRGTDTIRFADLDPQGHVNHAKFATFMETSRAAIIRDPNHSLVV